MRILSQDGTKDIPYEMAMIDLNEPRTENGQYNVYAQGRFIGIDPVVNFVLIASYSTEEKAKKVLEMLREKYRLYELDKLYTSEPHGIHVYFQFPADEDVEV